MSQARTLPLALQRLTDRFEPIVRRRFLAAVARLQARIPLAAILRSVKEGRMTAELRAALNRWRDDLAVVARDLNTVFALSAALTVRSLPTPLSQRNQIAVTQPLAVSRTDVGTAAFVNYLTTQLVPTIEETIRRAIAIGMSVTAAAVVIHAVIGLARTQARAVLAFHQRLTARGRDSARAIEHATRRYAEQLRRRRADTIAITETTRARSSGQLAVWRRARGEGILRADTRKVWITANDDRVCPVCAPLHLTTVPLDAPFPGNVDAPPVHHRCRCRVRITARSASSRTSPQRAPFIVGEILIKVPA